MDAPVIDRAIALARKHGLRATDALQLACALLAREDTVELQFILMGSDQELNAAAVAEQFQVLNPTGT